MKYALKYWAGFTYGDSYAELLSKTRALTYHLDQRKVEVHSGATFVTSLYWTDEFTDEEIVNDAQPRAMRALVRMAGWVLFERKEP